MKYYRLLGEEIFTNDGLPTEMNVLDFWRWHFCDRFDLQDKIAEYIVTLPEEEKFKLNSIDFMNNLKSVLFQQ